MTPWRMVLGGMVAAALLPSFPQFARGEPAQEKPLGAKDPSPGEKYIAFLKKYFDDNRARYIAKSDVPPILAKPIESRPGDDELRELIKARYNRVLAATAQAYVSAVDSRGNYDQSEEERTLKWSRVLLMAGLEAHGGSEHQAFLTGMLELCAKMTKRLEQERTRSRNPAVITTYRLPEWEEFTLDVRIALARAKKSGKGSN